MIVKTRDWVAPDFGAWPNLCTNTGGYQSYCSKVPLGWDNASYLHIARLKAATRVLPSVSWYGKERFTSTEYKRPVYNNCDHTLQKAFNYAYYTYDGTGYCSSCATNYPYWAIYLVAMRQYFPSATYADRSYLDDILITPDTYGELANAQRNAWHAMQPRFEGQVQLLNALFELKDFREVFRQFYKAFRPSSVLRALRAGIPRNRSLDLSKPAAGIYLTNALAIQPLLRDFAAIMQQITTIVEEAQQAFDIAGSETQKSHYSYVLHEGEQVDAIQKSYVIDRLTGKFEKLTFTATMEYTYEYRMRGLVRAFQKYWGLELDFEALWNAVPFSFILDYFTTLGRSIHNMEHDKNVNLAYSQYSESLLRTKIAGYVATKPSYIKPCCQAYKVYVDDKGYATSDSGVLLTDSARVPLSGYMSSNYRRRVCLPNKGTALPFFKKPTSTQGLTMAALIRSIF